MRARLDLGLATGDSDVRTFGLGAPYNFALLKNLCSFTNSDKILLFNN
jgi:hypothetical protein